MQDDPQAQTSDKQEAPVIETPESPMPSEEQKTPEGSGQQEPSPQKEQAIVDKPEPEGLPDEAKERTRQEFDKLRDKLREERSKREYYQSILGSQKKEEAPKMQPIYDPETGLLNEQALSERDKLLFETQERAKRAEESIGGYLVEQENREMFAAHPELNPKDKAFDKKLHALTRSIALDSMLNPDDYGGRQLTGKEAADVAKQFSGKTLEEAKKEGAKEALEQLTPKEQASLEATGSPARRTQIPGNLDDLKARTRKGDPEALVERLKRMESSSSPK